MSASRRTPRTAPGSEQSLRAQLQELLDWEGAHVGFDSVVEGIGAEHQGVVPPGAAHSPWQLLEHMRRAQTDILDFCLDPDYEEPSTMDEYWPPTPAPPSRAAWSESVAAFRKDLARLKRMAADPKVDLFAKIPHGSGQTYLRELVLVADHNAYHIGQLVLVRRLLGIWPK